MKISYNNYPILQSLKNKDLKDLPILEIDKDFFFDKGSYFIERWIHYSVYFSSEINVISTSFNNSAEIARAKLLGLYGDIAVGNNNDFQVSGTYIIGDQVHMINHIVKKNAPDDDIICYYVFDKSKTPLMMYIHNKKDAIKNFIWVSKFFKVNNIGDDLYVFLVKYFSKIVLLRMFKSYAEVETKTLKPKERIKDIDCKYTNDTDFTVTHLDSKWFTTLVNSQGFKVRGFFRLQPKKKDGEWTKELIWIDEFEKQGYNRQAKILNK
jgi:hypothetical protein